VIYENEHSRNLEKGDEPEHFFIIVEYFEETKEYKEKWFNSENYKQELDKYLKENGNERLFLPKNYSKEEGSRGDVGYIKKKYSILEKTKEYETVELYSEISDDDITIRYKVFYNGKVIPVYSFFDKYMIKTGYYGFTFMISLVIFVFGRILNLYLFNNIEKKRKTKDNLNVS